MNIKYLFSLLIILIISSCASHNGYLSSNAVLSNNNFKIVGLGVGTSCSSRLFGFGGLSEDALVLEAKRDLYKNYPLKIGQALTNITVDFKNSNYLVYKSTKVVLSAEIVDFNVADDTKKNENIYTLQSRFGFNLYDTVYCKQKEKFQNCYIVNLDTYSADVELTKDSTIIKKLHYGDLFKKKGSFAYLGTTYSIGDTITSADELSIYYRNEKFVRPTTKMTILAVSSNRVLLVNTKYPYTNICISY